MEALGAMLAEHDKRLVELAERQEELLTKIAENVPVVNIPPRPRVFDVVLDKDDTGETRGMRIAAKALN